MGPAAFLFLSRQNCRDLVWRKFSLLHPQQSPHHDPNHIVQKTVRSHRKGYQVSGPFHLGFRHGSGQVPLFPAVQGTERGKIVGPQIVTGCPVQQLYIDRVPIVEGMVPAEGIPHWMVPNFVNVFLSLAGVPGVKLQRDLFTRTHRHVLRQVVVQGSQQPLRGDGTLGFQADTKFPGVNSGIRSGARLDVLLPSGDPEQGFLKNLLDRQGVFLDLPPVVSDPVVRELDQQISFHGFFLLSFWVEYPHPAPWAETRCSGQ